jgi:replication-associated recombination protein RarA
LLLFIVVLNLKAIGHDVFTARPITESRMNTSVAAENELPVGLEAISEFHREEGEEEEKRTTSYSEKRILQKPYQIFDNIVGYNDVKKLFNMSLSSEKPIHILLVGPPASAKTLFMLECMKLGRSHFTLGSHSTKSGMIDYLFQKRPRYLIVDEIEHMPMKDQTALLSLMETGIVAETKFQKTRNTQLKTWVFATSNGTERMLTPLLSRFIVLHFKQYKYHNFQEVAVHILGREGVSIEIATAVADAVWSRMKSKDIRDCLKIGHLAKTKDDVNWIVETLKNYKK